MSKSEEIMLEIKSIIDNDDEINEYNVDSYRMVLCFTRLFDRLDEIEAKIEKLEAK